MRSRRKPGRKTLTVELEGNKIYTVSPDLVILGLVINANEARKIKMIKMTELLKMQLKELVALELELKAVSVVVTEAMAKVVEAQRKKSFGIANWLTAVTNR